MRRSSSSATDKAGSARSNRICSHRGTSLEWGRVEANGLRCCYHGWLYGTDGQCLEMPCETEEFRRKMDVWQEAYPTHEYGGLVFAYMGPPGTAPLFPMYDVIDTRYRKDVALKGMRVWGDYSAGYVKDCNWLQHYENIVDPYHLLILHKMISGEQFVGAMLQGSPQLSLEKTALGVRYRFVNDLPNGNRLMRFAECVVPNIFLIPDIRCAAPRNPAADPRDRIELGGAGRQRDDARPLDRLLAARR